MKKFVSLILCLFIYQISMAQDNRKHYDFIISVDEEIVKTLTKPKIIIRQGADIVKTIDVKYHPGNLSLSCEDFNLISSNEKGTLFLQFDFYQYSPKGKQEIYNYEIEMGKNWFEQLFVILSIYNLDKRKYRKILDPLSKDKNYTFDLETSQGQMIRIRKR